MSRLRRGGGTLPAGRDFLLVFALLAAGMVTMVFGLLALLGWVSGWLRLANFGANLMPMAPSTAVLLLLYGVAICLRARAPLSRRAYWFSVALVGLGSLVALLLFTLGCLRIQWAGEHFGLNLTGMIGGAAIGHISLVSAFCLLLASVSFLASLSQSALRSWRAALALISAGVVLATSFVFLLTYLYGTPLLYGGSFIPPALNTLLAQMILGLALLALASESVGWLSGPGGDDTREVISLGLIFVLLAAGILGAGYIYYRHYEKAYRAQVERELLTIVDLKVSELAQWRKERLGEADILFQNIHFSTLVQRFLGQSRDTEAQQRLRIWAEKFKAHYQTDRVSLLDAQGNTRLTMPAGLGPCCPETVSEAFEALREGQVRLQDFNRHESGDPVYLAVLVPVFAENDAKLPLGVFVLHINPNIYLYPFLKRWPTPSRTAETLLVRREGKDVLYLNDLRHQTNAALALRLPLTRAEVPAVRAALGQTGIMAGVDYRGVPGLSAVQAVPDSPWFMVAKVDMSEVDAPLRKRFWEMSILLIVLIFGAGGGVGMIRWRQHVRFYRDQAESAESLRKSESRFRRLFDQANDGIMVLDSDGRLISVNESFARMHGYRPAEMSGMTLKDLDTPDTLQRKPERMARLLAGETLTFEVEHYHKDGHVFPLEVSASLIAIGEQALIQCFHRDSTEREQAAKVLSQSRTAALNMMRDAIEARDQSEQMSQALRASEGRYRSLVETTFDWVWEMDAQGRYTFASPRVWDLLGYRPEEMIGRTPFDFMPEDEARRVQAVFAQIAVRREPFAVLENTNRHRDGRLVVAETSGTPILSPEGTLLGYRGMDRDITARKHAEEALRHAQTLLQSVTEGTSDAIYVKDLQGRYLMLNAAAARLVSKPSEEVLGKDDTALFAPDEARRVMEGDRRVMASDSVQTYEELVTSRGVARTLLSAKGPVRDAQGKVIGLFGVARDITERKQAEETLRQSRQAALNLMADAVEARERSEQISQALRAREEEIRELNRTLEQRVVERTAELLAANQELDAFAYAVSHDLRQPLRAMNGFSQALVEDFGATLPGAAHEFLNHIIQGSQRMGELIDGLLRLSRTTRGELRRDAVDLSALAARLLGELAVAEPERRVTWTVAPGLTAQGDERLIEVVLANLLGNAWKYTARQPEAKIEVGTVAAEVTRLNTPKAESGKRKAESDQSLLTSAATVFFVRDNGAGFDMKHAAKLFHPFQRLHREDEFTGIGIGLATVQRIVQRHGGTIRATAAPGQGATFSFSLSASDSKNKEQ